MADRRAVATIFGGWGLRNPFNDYPTDANWSRDLWESRVKYLPIYQNGIEKSFLSWEWWEIRTPHYDLGYKDIGRSAFNTMLAAAQAEALQHYTQGIVLPEDTPTDYQLNAYVIMLRTDAGEEIRLCRKPVPAASEYTGRKGSRTPVTNNEETFFTATDNGLQVGRYARLPYSNIVEIYPLIYCVKAINEGKAPYYND